MENQSQAYVKDIKDGVIILSGTTYVSLVRCDGVSILDVPQSERTSFLTADEKMLKNIPFPLGCLLVSKAKRVTPLKVIASYEEDQIISSSITHEINNRII